jgi:hypothetical protein
MTSFPLINFSQNLVPVGFVILFAFGLVVLGLLVKFAIVIIGRRKVYKAKSVNLLNASEIRFFDTLSKIVPPNTYISPKVRIADLVDVNLPKESREFWSSFNRISQKHVDFTVCNRSDFAPLLIIELDGGSHDELLRQKRDQFVDEVFKEAGIPILHIRVSSFYDEALIKAEVDKLLHPPQV